MTPHNHTDRLPWRMEILHNETDADYPCVIRDSCGGMVTADLDQQEAVTLCRIVNSHAGCVWTLKRIAVFSADLSDMDNIRKAMREISIVAKEALALAEPKEPNDA